MFSQQRAITGRRIRPNQVAMINAQTPYILDRMALEDRKSHNTAMQKINEQNFLLNWKGGHEGRKDANRAQNLSLLKLGAGAYFQNRGNTAVNEMLDAADKTPDVSGMSTPQADFQGINADINAAGQSTGAKVWEGGVSKLKDFGSKLTKPTTLLGGAIGGWAGKKYGGKNKYKKAAIGAGVGAGSQWVLGGGLKNFITGTGGTDWYSSALSGALGGALSLFS